MSLPTFSGVGRLTEDPELTFLRTGVAVCRVRIAFNSRKKTDSGEWVDADVCYMTGSAWRELAENVAESLTKGTEVFVSGRLKTRKYTDRTGEERSTTDLEIDAIGPALRWSTVRVTKMARKSDSPPADALDDPWARELESVGVGAVDDSEPPF